MVLFKEVTFLMAYFLKKTNLKRGTYLQIYESFYNHDKKQTSHKCFQTIGYVDDLIASGISNPIEHFQNEVNKLNLEKQEAKNKLIDKSPHRFFGYCLIKNIMNGLNVEKYIKILGSNRKFEFDLYSVLEALIFSRCVNPCSKFKSFHDVIPYLVDEYNFSYAQLLEAIEFIGSEYEKVIEIFTSRVNSRYSISTSTTYFDCTNFYFEIDREDDFRKKGPSKENRKDPIVGMGLLLDANLLPIGMKLYPGNESEKPVLNDIIQNLKLQNHIVGKTVHVADKGLNCAGNIYNSHKRGDGYLFSKSVKMLSQLEQEWVLLSNDYQKVVDKDGNLLYSYKSCVDYFSYEFKDEKGKKHSFKIKEKRVATYNESLAKKHKLEIEKMILKANNLCLSKAKKSEFGESGKYVSFKSTDSAGDITNDTVVACLNQELIEKDLKLAGYNLLITSEYEMSDIDIYNTYHNLWRIEQSFRIMKSELDARPVFLQKEDSIKGHFTICYLSVLLSRILEFKILNNKFPSSQIYDFIRNYNLTKLDTNEYVNISSTSSLLTYLAATFNLPYTCFYLNDKQIKMMLSKLL